MAGGAYQRLDAGHVARTLARLEARMAARFPERNIRHVAAELRGLVGEADDQVDMHQLTKDPERLRADFPATAESPTVELTADELGRYLDYCSELLPLVAKGRRCARSRPRMRSCSTP